MNALDKIVQSARAARRRIVLAEGEDLRVAGGAVRAEREGIARIVLLGRVAAVEKALAAANGDPRRFRIEDPARSSLLPDYAGEFHRLRQGKGVDEAAAAATMRNPLYFADMMVRLGEADGSIGGAVATTAETVRAALQVIGRAPDAAIVSSFFLMVLNASHHARQGAHVFADCGLVIEPDARELAAIALSSARSFEALTDERARVAMLSFSTMGSASHPRIAKVTEALALARKAAPALLIDGELQFDAAFVESVGRSKAPGSTVAGSANVFVFPNLEAGNIGYKIAQRIGGAEAIGPILQGLAKPANDLSRGCTADDVFHLIAVTAAQAAG